MRGDSADGDTQHLGYLLGGFVLEVPQNQDRSLHAGQRGEGTEKVLAEFGITIHGGGRRFRLVLGGHLGAPGTPSPPGDEGPVNGGADLSLKMAVVLAGGVAAVGLGSAVWRSSA